MDEFIKSPHQAPFSSFSGFLFKLPSHWTLILGPGFIAAKIRPADMRQRAASNSNNGIKIYFSI